MPRFAHALTLLVATGFAMQPALASAKEHAGHDAAKPAMAGHAMPGMVHAKAVDAAGKDIGMVMLEQTPGGVLITTDIKGLPQGEHGFHFHEIGKCEPAMKFTTAGGHFNPSAHKHGIKVEGGPHGGDMPNQFVGSDGMLKAQIVNSAIMLGDGTGSVKDADGTALIIHADADDYTTQPTGNAGGRIACAVISAPK
jgi:superoxide dismutase, Cu-Zn family